MASSVDFLGGFEAFNANSFFFSLRLVYSFVN